MRKHLFATPPRDSATALPSQSPRLSPDSHIPDYFLRFSPVVMPVKVARCFHDHTGWFNNIRRNILMATAAAGSNMTFSPSQNGTSLDLQAGLEARVRENITLGVQAGYVHSVSGSSAEGYNGQATLNVTF
ncbi:autotransporter domain-containing protein [Escherichia coli]|nr:autotransporter domain-containing protein [Escherichia coli]